MAFGPKGRGIVRSACPLGHPFSAADIRTIEPAAVVRGADEADHSVYLDLFPFPIGDRVALAYPVHRFESGLPRDLFGVHLTPP